MLVQSHSLPLRYIDKIRQSLVALLGAPGEQRPMQFDEIKELPLLQACFYEAVRVRLLRCDEEIDLQEANCAKHSSGRPCPRT